jgi:uncharacterized metal-binding protein YceD (DUF177 family)
MSSSHTPSEPRGSGRGASRFSYDIDTEPEEGGVRAVGSNNPDTRGSDGETRSARLGGAARPGPSGAGAPGPAERLLDISELARSVGMRYTHRFDIPAHPADYIEYAGPLVGQVTLTNTGAALLLGGDVAATLRLECARCLRFVNVPVEAELDEQFDLVTSRNAYHQEEVQAVDEDTPASVIKGNVLDLGELLRQNLLLAAPPQPLCSEECAGLPNPAADTAPDEEQTTSVNATAAFSDERGNNALRNLAGLLAARGDDQNGLGNGA